jgi:parallel beta-helix repeat protein
MKDCKKCGMSYDPKEFDACPYCGEGHETEPTAEAVKIEEKKQPEKEPVSLKAKPQEKSKPVREKSGGSLKYILIGLVAVALIAAVIFGISAFSGSGATVPDKYATIQEAIDAAQDGDEITVQMGVYRENLDFKGKNIVVRSIDPDDPAVVSSTIIDGDRRGPVVSFRSGEGEGAVLSGFTVTRGGGILISGGSTPLIEKCSIEDNSAEFGAGLFIVDSNPLIRENIIAANRAYIGGGIFIEKSSPILEGNIIAGNTAEMGAGLAIFSNSDPVLTDNTIVDNRAARLGGGIFVTLNSAPLITNNTIGGNFAELNGGGLFVEESQPVIEDNMIIGNQAENGGGMIIVFILDPGLRLTGNTFESNLAYRAGGGVYMVGSSPIFESNSFKDNSSEFLGGAVAVYDSAPVFIRNNFENNIADATGGGGAMWISKDSTLEISDPDDNVYLGNNPDDLFRE